MLSKVKNYITDNVGILIRIDDVAENMNWDLMEKSELLFEKYGIKPVLGVIPNNKDKELLSYPKRNDFWERVRKWRRYETPFNINELQSKYIFNIYNFGNTILY